MYPQLARLHAHCPACGAPVHYDASDHAYRNLTGGRHSCDDIREEPFVCACGELLIRSPFGHIRERETGRPHLCELDVDRIERDLAFDRRAWQR